MEKALIINYSDVSIALGDYVVLHDVNLQVHEGEFVYLTGLVGSGKSSLLKTIYAELDILTGIATVLGRDLTRLRRSQVPALRRELGIVFQDFRLLTDRNVRRNLDFVLRATGWSGRAKRESRIAEVLAQVEMSDKADAMPYELSGGEQQRICLARALLNSPRLILADEATGHQDTGATLRTTQLLHELAASGTAVIMATHDATLPHQFPGTIYRCANGTLNLERTAGQAAETAIPTAQAVPEAIIEQQQ